MQDPDYDFLLNILQGCETRQQCDANDPSGSRCENYYLCYSKEATPEVKKAQADKIKQFKIAMKKLDNFALFIDGIIEQLHLAL
jgi:hypothetical protein